MREVDEALGARLRRFGPIAPDEAARVIGDVARALAAEHARGTVYSQLCPESVLIDAVGNARLGERPPVRRRKQQPRGVEGYTAPEVARGGDPTPASDVWSLGATAYAAVEGHGPFPGVTDTELVLRLATQPVPSAAHAGALGPVIAAMLSVNPLGRPSASEVAAQLLAFSAPEPAVVDDVPDPVPVDDVPDPVVVDDVPDPVAVDDVPDDVAESAMETVEPETVEPETVEPETVEPETVEPETVEPDAVELEAVEPATGDEAAQPAAVAEPPRVPVTLDAGTLPSRLPEDEPPALPSAPWPQWGSRRTERNVRRAERRAERQAAERAKRRDARRRKELLAAAASAGVGGPHTRRRRPARAGRRRGRGLLAAASFAVVPAAAVAVAVVLARQGADTSPTGAGGAASSARSSSSVAPPPVTITSQCTGRVCTFGIAPGSDFPVDSVTWIFGDGAQATGAAQAVHVYRANGTYTAYLDIRSDGRTLASRPVVVTVNGVALYRSLTLLAGRAGTLRVRAHESAPAQCVPAPYVLQHESRGWHTVRAGRLTAAWTVLRVPSPGRYRIAIATNQAVDGRCPAVVSNAVEARPAPVRATRTATQSAPTPPPAAPTTTTTSLQTAAPPPSRP